MRPRVLLLALGLLSISTLSIWGYRSFTTNFEIKPKESVLGEQLMSTLRPNQKLTPKPTFRATSTPSPTQKPTFKPIPTNAPVPANTPMPTSIPTPLPNTDNQQPNSPNNSNTVNANPSQDENEPSDSEQEDWVDNRPRDSHGNVCAYGGSHCKYECSISDSSVDDLLRILNNHLWEYQKRLKFYGSDSSKTKIWEDAVMKTYNMIYEECKDSPIYNPQDPL